jgi:hypothetical protein
METATGKTYVYLRTTFELTRAGNWLDSSFARNAFTRLTLQGFR